MTPLFQATDPNLAAALRSAPGGGIWLAAQPGEDPNSYAARLAALSAQYHPSVIVPDIEAVGKGYQGSPGWDWNQAFVSMFRALAPNQNFAVTVMPNQDDFNYRAYQNAGVSAFLPQAYGATYSQQFNPAEVVQRLIANGVPANLIQPVLAPGQSYNGPASRYALDDFSSSTPIPQAFLQPRYDPGDQALVQQLANTPARVIGRSIGRR